MSLNRGRVFLSGFVGGVVRVIWSFVAGFLNHWHAAIIGMPRAPTSPVPRIPPSHRLALR
jgi:hypothetical protein